MNLKSILTSRTVLTALAVVVVAVLGAFLLFPNSSRENATSRPDHTGHVKEAPEAPAPGAAMTANDGTLPSRKITSYRSTMMPGEVSQTPRKDSMGMDMVPIYESEGSMLELSEHARAMASVETVPVQRRKTEPRDSRGRQGAIQRDGAREHHHARRGLRRAAVRGLHRRRSEGGRPSRGDLQSRPGRGAAGVAHRVGQSAQRQPRRVGQAEAAPLGPHARAGGRPRARQESQRPHHALLAHPGHGHGEDGRAEGDGEAGRDALPAREPRIGLGLSRHLRIRTAVGAIRPDGRNQIGGSSRPELHGPRVVHQPGAQRGNAHGESAAQHQQHRAAS